MPGSTFMSNEWLDHLLRSENYPDPDNLFVSLHTASPTDAGGVGEVSGNAYARQQIGTGGDSLFSIAASKTTSNESAIVFPEATGSWGTITHLGFSDAITTGNLIFHGPLDVSKIISSGDQAQFNALALSVTIA